MTRIQDLIKEEEVRQEETLMMIPSENYASKAVRDAVGSRLLNKYAEGYPGRRYYQGNKIVDEIENFTRKKAKELFGVEHVNVQPYSGSPANAEILFALVSPGGKIMGLKLSSGGHLTHGHPDITFSGKFYKSIQFGTKDDGVIDYDEVQKLANQEKPELMIIGTTAYPLILDWTKLGEIADSINAYLVADISHVAGLVIAGAYPSPVDHVHVVMTTTHKTLRGPRGAMIMVTSKGIAKDAEIVEKIDKAVFPGLQGGPHNNTTAGIGQALIEADTPEFRKYGIEVVANAKVLAEKLIQYGFTLVTGGTECHLIVIDLRPLGLTGNIVAEALEAAGIVVNRNSVPNDGAPPFYPSGIRLGTPGLTTRGMGQGEMEIVAGWIKKVVDHVKDEKLPEDKEEKKIFMKTFRDKLVEDEFYKEISSEVKELCAKFPTP